MKRSATKASRNGDANKLAPEDRPAHDWFRFVLSYPPHLVREYLERFGAGRKSVVLDPFSGTGTTVVECRKLGISGVGIEANPFAHLACEVKTDWAPDPDALLAHAECVAAAVEAEFEATGIDDLGDAGGLFAEATATNRAELRTLPAEQMDLLLSESISPLPLHKTLVLLDHLQNQTDDRFHRHELVALAKALVFSISNLHFGPEVGVQPAKPDAPVLAPWLREVRAMVADLRDLRKRPAAPSVVHLGDAREASKHIAPRSIDAVITSPPYPNEKDYTRTTRLESVILGFARTNADVRSLKKTLVRSNTRSVYVADTDDEWVKGNAEVQRIAAAIEARRLELGKTSGFEKMYPRVTKLYFGGMVRHLADLRAVLRPGARLAYVVGDQASYLRVMIRTGQILGDIAKSLTWFNAG